MERQVGWSSRRAQELADRSAPGAPTRRSSSTCGSTYYGTPTPLNQMATDQRARGAAAVVQPWDRSQLGAIEKAIRKSDSGLNPTNDGKIIRLPIPPLTEERRKELVKMVQQKRGGGPRRRSATCAARSPPHQAAGEGKTRSPRRRRRAHGQPAEADRTAVERSRGSGRRKETGADGGLEATLATQGRVAVSGRPTVARFAEHCIGTLC